MAPIDLPSPNFNDRADGAVVDMLVLHYTGMETARAALDQLCDPAAKVSAHYTVDEDGTVYRHVDEAKRAWHAGVSFWAGATDVNSRSVGIEIVNPGHEFGYRPFPEAQMATVIDLAHGILAHHPIPAHRVLGHSDVAPRRKQDPGELFDWPRLAAAGIGLWPDGVADGPAVAVGEIQEMLAAFGYEAPQSGALDAETRVVATAFQRHFRPALLDGELDDETVGRLRALLALVGAASKPVRG